ncbi:MAG: hypothetical protein JO075_05460 [Acidimicrobiia bacterium]|nr:hypothetical protein [Acidimicrobiia bacterium]
MDVAVVTDRAFLPWCATALRSCARATHDANVRLHVLVHPEVSPDEGKGLIEAGTVNGATVSIRMVDEQAVAALPSKGPALGGRMCWQRILLAESLPEIDRVIYLDADTLVRHSVLPLWNSLTGAPIAAVANVTEPWMESHLHSLGLEDPKDYFNAGVLVLDLAAWRAAGATDRLLGVARCHRRRWYDQDTLNIVFAGRWQRLHPRWNAMNSLWWWADHARRVLPEDELDAARADPSVVHFEGPPVVKPWHFLSQHPFRGEYRTTLDETHWAGQPLEERTLATRLIAKLPADRRLTAYGHWKRASDRARAAPAVGRRRAINLAARLNAKRRNPRVSTAVSANDNMLFEGTLRLYFEVGADALEQIRVGLDACGIGEPERVLDCPSGYGRVLRYMRAAWPNAQLVAMELSPGAPEFCAVTFGARPVQSANPLWSVDGVGDGFDLVWSGSLLTHFNSDAWAPTLDYFRRRLRVGGALIFTTHGERSIALIERDPATVDVVRAACSGWSGDYGIPDAGSMVARVRDSGFAFTAYEGSHDWGISVSTAEWVRRRVDDVGGLELVRHAPHGWSEHQDVWTFKRS